MAFGANRLERLRVVTGPPILSAAHASPIEPDQDRVYPNRMPQSADTPAAIELRVEHIARLFDPLDPFPIPSRDLAKSAEDFILGWARELPRDAPIRIVVHMPESEAQRPEAAALGDAIATHFGNSAARIGGDLLELFRVGRIALAIGLAVLAACVLGGRILAGMEGPLARLFSEGLLILGWVANWRPIEIFLYEWWPLVRRRRLHRRLAEASVEILPLTGERIEPRQRSPNLRR
jgi:hypothetical protein